MLPYPLSVLVMCDCVSSVGLLSEIVAFLCHNHLRFVQMWVKFQRPHTLQRQLSWSLSESYASVNDYETLFPQKSRLLQSMFASGDFCRLLITFARSGPTACWSWSKSKSFDPGRFFLKKKELISKKNQQATKKNTQPILTRWIPTIYGLW